MPILTPKSVDIEDPHFAGFRNACDLLLVLPNVKSHPHVCEMLKEAQRRFQQMHYLLDVATSATSAARQHVFSNIEPMFSSAQKEKPIDPCSCEDDPAIRAAWNKLTDLMGHAILHTEMFYIIAFRQVTITRYLNKRIFGKERIVKEPAGVRDARNKLILHPEQTVEAPSFFAGATFETGGVMFNSGREAGSDQGYADSGFASNVAEFDAFWTKWWVKTHNRLLNDDFCFLEA